MISLQKCVPEIYYNQSRDFQFVARTLEVLANYLKTNADVLKGFPQSKNFDIRLLTLLAYTLGFVSKHNYNTDDLFAVCASFNEILKYKGSMDAVEMAIRVLLNAQQIDKSFDVKRDNLGGDTRNLLIYLPIEVTDIVLLEDIFDYILPAGFTYSFVFADFSDGFDATSLTTSDDLKSKQYVSNKLGQVTIPGGSNNDRFTFENQPNDLSQTTTGVVVKPE